jgi:hypothetical protein
MYLLLMFIILAALFDIERKVSVSLRNIHQYCS